MKINMNDSRITNISQIRKFLKGTQMFDLSLRDASISDKYHFVDKTIDKLKYEMLCKKDKRAVVNYLKKITGYKGGNLYRLISRAKEGELVRKVYHRKNRRISLAA